jgi:hypothetical protein
MSLNGHWETKVNRISTNAKARIEAQGFVGLDDRTLAQIDYWLRLSPAICMLWTVIGTALNSPTILWSLVPFTALGALLTGHPFDVLYNHGFRYLVDGPPLPRYPLPRRVACLMATATVGGAAWGFQSGHTLIGHILVWSLVAAAFANVSTGFCVPSFIYGILSGKPSSCTVRRAPL